MISSQGKRVNFYQPKSELENHRDTIEQYFPDNPVASIAEAVVKIEALTGIRRSKNQVREFLKKIGMRFRKVGAVPTPTRKPTLKKIPGSSDRASQRRKALSFLCGCRSFCLCTVFGILVVLCQAVCQNAVGQKTFQRSGRTQRHQPRDDYGHQYWFHQFVKRVSAVGKAVSTVCGSSDYRRSGQRQIPKVQVGSKHSTAI